MQGGVCNPVLKALTLPLSLNPATNLSGVQAFSQHSVAPRLLLRVAQI